MCTYARIQLHTHTHIPPTHTFVLPVKERRLTRLSLAMASPMSAPPLTVVQMAGGRLFAANTLCTILVTAMLARGVVGAPFLGREEWRRWEEGRRKRRWDCGGEEGRRWEEGGGREGGMRKEGRGGEGGRRGGGEKVGLRRGGGRRWEEGGGREGGMKKEGRGGEDGRRGGGEKVGGGRREGGRREEGRWEEGGGKVGGAE